jgi:putative HD superfamily hydrolase of NAD metabolism
MDYVDFIKEYHLDKHKNLESNIADFYRQTNTLSTYRHCLDVAKEAIKLDNWFKEDLYIAGLLHDISAFIPTSCRLEVSQALNIPILEEEQESPLLLHQKLSAYIVKKCFKINDAKTISAIKCHTTLKGNFTDFDLALFLADKIAWDQPGIPPYLSKLETSLNSSKEAAALVYIDYLFNNGIKVIHPWLRSAKERLETK